MLKGFTFLLGEGFKADPAFYDKISTLLVVCYCYCFPIIWVNNELLADSKLDIVSAI